MVHLFPPSRIERADDSAFHAETRRYRRYFPDCQGSWLCTSRYLMCGPSGNVPIQGSSIFRFLLVEAGQTTVRSLPVWRSRSFHSMMRRGRKIAKVAIARRLAVCLYWMMRQGRDYQQWVEFSSHARQPGNRHGV